jgi:phosphoribosyl 1,2-cyclic phosphodiesterase
VGGTIVRVTALASGSSGNAYLVEVGTTRVLFDAGLAAPDLVRYLTARGVPPATLSGIFISHEHSDHIRGVGALARRYRLPVVANRGTFRAGASMIGPLPETIELPTGEACRAGVLTVRTFPVSHDAADPVGFWLEAAGRHVCICTDLGQATPALDEPLAAADLLVLEANHDLDRLWRGPYPAGLKRRVAGPQGHLANAAAAQLVSRIAQDGRARTVWLAHLSATNNTPALARAAVTDALAAVDATGCTVAVAGRDRPSLVWDDIAAPVAAQQLPLPF